MYWLVQSVFPVVTVTGGRRFSPSVSVHRHPSGRPVIWSWSSLNRPEVVSSVLNLKKKKFLYCLYSLASVLHSADCECSALHFGACLWTEAHFKTCPTVIPQTGLPGNGANRYSVDYIATSLFLVKKITRPILLGVKILVNRQIICHCHVHDWNLNSIQFRPEVWPNQCFDATCPCES